MGKRSDQAAQKHWDSWSEWGGGQLVISGAIKSKSSGPVGLTEAGGRGGAGTAARRVRGTTRRRTASVRQPAPGGAPAPSLPPPALPSLTDKGPLDEPGLQANPAPRVLHMASALLTSSWRHPELDEKPLSSGSIRMLNQRNNLFNFKAFLNL